MSINSDAADIPNQPLCDWYGASCERHVFGMAMAGVLWRDGIG